MPPFELIIARFDGVRRAQEVIRDRHPAILILSDTNMLKLVNRAVLRKSPKGKLAFQERDEVRRRDGAMAGALAGGLVGTLSGPGGMLIGALAGAVTGGATASVIDSGFKTRTLRALGQQMPNDSSAIIALVEHNYIDALENRLAELGGEVEVHSLEAEAKRRLNDMIERQRHIDSGEDVVKGRPPAYSDDG